jgi:prevent-host-death family protein
MDWKIANAKSQFSELISLAVKEPQIVCNRQNPVAVVLSYEEYNRLKDLDVVLHRRPKWAKFAEYSIQLVDKKNLPEIELPSRSDRRDFLF